VSARNLVYEALVLRARESPGGSRILTLMTAESGLVDVFVFGGPKSKLRSLASPYASGRAFVYLDPVKDFQKLSDFDVRDSYPALRDELERLWGAGLIAELLIKTTGGGGDYSLVLELALDSFSALDRSKLGQAQGPILLFVWHLVSLLGLGPDPTVCVLCGAEIRPASGGAYSFAREGFLCPACAAREANAGRDFLAETQVAEGSIAPFVGNRGRIVRLGPDAFRWFERASSLPFAEADRLGIEADCVESVKALVFGLARQVAEAPLASFSYGADLA
jgi:DNA repair protein RecO (recombination protein O)